MSELPTANSTLLISALTGSVFLIVIFIGAAAAHFHSGQRTRLRRRMKALFQDAGSAATRDISRSRRRLIQSKLKELEEGSKKRRAYRLREELSQAGLDIDTTHFILIAVALAAAASGTYFAFDLPAIGIPLIAVTVGLGAPKSLLAILRRRRRASFLRHFADAIDIIVRGVKSGLPIGECINIVAREIPEPVGSEFRLIQEGQQVGLTLTSALERAVMRTPLPELSFFAIVLSIQQQTGGNLAETLAKLSDVLRQRKKMHEKIQAMSSEAKASAMIIGSLPILVTVILVLVAPDYIGLLFSTVTGNYVIGAGLALMGGGILVMKKMINFDL